MTKSEKLKKAWKRRTKTWRKRFSKEQSKRTIAQMARQWADPVWRAKMLKVRKEQAQRPEVKKKLSISAKKMWVGTLGKKNRAERKNRWTPAYREKMLKAGFLDSGSRHPNWSEGYTKATHPALARMSKRLMGVVPDFGRWLYLYDGPNGKIWMRSTWEVSYAHWADNSGTAWKYEPKYFYVGKGPWKGETYKPDFYLPKIGKYFDVKGYYSPENRAKIEKFREKWPKIKFSLLDREDLKALGINLNIKYKRKKNKGLKK